LRKLLFYILILFVASVACSGDEEAYKINIDNFDGVWANENCELVKTGVYELLFERSGDSITSSIRLLERKGNKVTIDLRGVAVFDTLSKTASIKSKDLISGSGILVNADNQDSIKLGVMDCNIMQYPEKLVIRSNGMIIEELSTVEKKLRVLFPSGNWQNLDLVEKLEVTSPYEVIKATPENIGVCLQQWTLGTSFQVDNHGDVNTIEIGTNRHSYVFNFNQSDDNLVIYCRAARIRSDNNGTVFAQNIRLMSNRGEFTAFIYPDNLEMTAKPLAIQDSLFNPKMCVYGEDAIYWSVKDFSDTMIVLNGCGEDYIYTRPRIDSGRIIEWFEFVEY
jgi:hypothetical protein